MLQISKRTQDSEGKFVPDDFFATAMLKHGPLRALCDKRLIDVFHFGRTITYSSINDMHSKESFRVAIYAQNEGREYSTAPQARSNPNRNRFDWGQ